MNLIGKCRDVASNKGQLEGSSLVHFRSDISGLRAIAVTLVLLFHFEIGPFHGGFIGVDVFFVISGFLMTKIVTEGVQVTGFTIFQFYKARSRRIIPALTVMVAIVLAIAWFLADPIAYARLAGSGLTSLLFVSNIQYLFTAGYFSPLADSIWFLHTWSLSVEWQIYLTFPIIWAEICKRYNSRLIPILSVFTAIGITVDSALALIDVSKINYFIFYMFPPRMPEITAGGLVYILQNQGYPPIKAWFSMFLEVGGVALIVLASVILTPGKPWPGWQVIIPIIGTMAILFSNRGEESAFNNILCNAIGSWSYSIYLWHWPILVGLIYVNEESKENGLLLIFVSIILGAVSCRFVEQRAVGRAAARRCFAGKKTLYVLFVGTVVAAATISLTGGVPSRSPASTANIIEQARLAKEDWTFPSDCDGRLCVVSNGSQSRTLVVGDSHAEMWYLRLKHEAVATNRSIDMIATAGCMPVPGIVKIGKIACTRSSATISELVTSERYQRIVFIASWHDYLQPEKNPRYCFQTTEAVCRPVTDVDASVGAQSVFLEFIKRASQTGARIIVLAPTPVAPFNVPERIAKRAFSGGIADVRTMRAFPRRLMVKDTEHLANLLAKMRYLGVAVPNPGASLCSRETCQLVDHSGISLYRDNTHLRNIALERLPTDWLWR